MSISEESLRSLYLQWNAEHFNGELPEDLPIVWNRRLRTVAGKCHYKMREGSTQFIDVKYISLNPRLLITEENLRATLIHEMVHGWLAHNRGVRDKHNWRFQDKMNSIFGYKESHRCHSYDTSEVREKRDIEYHCPTHGVIGRRARMPRSYNLNRYHCNRLIDDGTYKPHKCGELITFVDKRKAKPKTAKTAPGLVGGFNPFA